MSDFISDPNPWVVGLFFLVVGLIVNAYGLKWAQGIVNFIRRLSVRFNRWWSSRVAHYSRNINMMNDLRLKVAHSRMVLNLVILGYILIAAFIIVMVPFLKILFELNDLKWLPANENPGNPLLVLILILLPVLYVSYQASYWDAIYAAAMIRTYKSEQENENEIQEIMNSAYPEEGDKYQLQRWLKLWLSRNDDQK